MSNNDNVSGGDVQNKGQGSSGAQGIAQGVGSTLGNAIGGVGKTFGGLVGTAGRGVGETFNNTTGTKVVGDSLQAVTGGVESGANRLGQGIEDAGQPKKS